MTHICLRCNSLETAELTWRDFVPTCAECSRVLLDVFGKPLTEGATQGRCLACVRTWHVPGELFSDSGEWDWAARDLYNVDDFASAGERAELAAHATPPEEHR